MISFGLLLVSVLFPVKMWFAPSQSLHVDVKPQDQAVRLVLTDFTGKLAEAQSSPEVAGERQVDIRTLFPVLETPGTYILYALPGGVENGKFVGTPLLIEVREVNRPDAPGPTAIRIEPLRYGVIKTDRGEMTVGFYFDVAPNTVANFIKLAEGGFYNGLTWHRIMPAFCIQTGDPRGDGRGGPGYQIHHEFNERPHEAGVLSMARAGAADEVPNVPPRPEYANSAGSQFFIALDYKNTWQLDGRYTVFGKVTDGLDVVNAIASVPLADEKLGRPQTPPIVQSVEIHYVTADKNPYATLLQVGSEPTTQPVGR